MLKNQLQIQTLYSNLVTDDKDDSGIDVVTVEAERIPQDESNSEGEL